MTKPKASRPVGQRVESKVAPNETARPAKPRLMDLPDDTIDHIHDGALFVRPDAKSPITTPQMNESTRTYGDSNHDEIVVVDGVAYEKNKQIFIDPVHIKAVFEGNKRSILKNIEELAAHIVQVGKNTEPVLLRPNPKGVGFEVVKGSRRTAAVRYAKANMNSAILLNAIIREMDDIEATIEAAAENLHRDDFSPWERANQMQVLLDSGACQSIEDLMTYLPATKKAPSRTLVYYYLKPAHIDASVRNFINEEIEVSINKISNLKDILEDHPNNISKFVEHLAGFCKPNTLSVQDLIQYANRFFAQHKKPIEKQVKTFASRSGKDALKIEVSAKGKIQITLDKAVSEDYLVLLTQQIMDQCKSFSQEIE